MKRPLAVILLVGVNLALLACLVHVAFPPPAAQAQAIGGAGNFLVVCGNIQSDYDAIYVIDLGKRVLHTFTVKKGKPEVEYRGARDLKVDFRRESGQP
jgi:hypothetical protein